MLGRHLTTARRATALVALASVAVLGGCKSNDPNDVSYSAITGNLTPELVGMTERPIDADRNWRLAQNLNLRLLHEDWTRFWITDKPTRLSPYETVDLDGVAH